MPERREYFCIGLPSPLFPYSVVLAKYRPGQVGLSKSEPQGRRRPADQGAVGPVLRDPMPTAAWRERSRRSIADSTALATQNPPACSVVNLGCPAFGPRAYEVEGYPLTSMTIVVAARTARIRRAIPRGVSASVSIRHPSRRSAAAIVSCTAPPRASRRTAGRLAAQPVGTGQGLGADVEAVVGPATAGYSEAQSIASWHDTLKFVRVIGAVHRRRSVLAHMIDVTNASSRSERSASDSFESVRRHGLTSRKLRASVKGGT